jgi:hypothetical protein
VLSGIILVVLLHLNHWIMILMCCFSCKQFFKLFFMQKIGWFNRVIQLQPKFKIKWRNVN